jgi:DNA-binding transcriptional LysR family regulator
LDVGQPSLDQLRLFLAVADEGSFNAAARKLGRAISVVSYGVANLENQLGVTLFAREGSRKPELTEAGTALLAEARAVADDVDALLAKVRSLHQGLEAELALAMDVMAPNTIVASVLREFQRMFPTVNLRLYVEALGAIGALVLDGRCTLGFGGDMIADLPELSRQRIGSVELIPVAAPGHPLAKAARREPGETRKHLQLVLTDRSPLTAGREFSVVAARTWRLADLGAKHALLREGIGWGNMPKHAVAGDLQRGELTELQLPEHTAISYQLNALWRKDAPLGPAATWMLDAFKARLEEECAAFTGK